MAYLNCPTCRLTVYSPTFSATAEECPRCRARLGKVSRLFRSALPPRVLDAARPPGGREKISAWTQRRPPGRPAGSATTSPRSPTA